jgi:hypothetical protein
LKPGDLFGFLFLVRHFDQVPFGGACCGKDSLEFNGGDDIGEFQITVIVESRGIKRFEPGGEDDRSHIKGLDSFFLIEINGFSWTEFLACLAFAVLEVDAVVMIDGILQGHGLGILHIGGLALDKTRIVGVNDLFGAFYRTLAAGNTFVFINISGALNKLNLKGACLSAHLFYLTQRF